MEPATWVIGTVVALALLHLLLLGYLGSRRNADALPAGGDGSADPGGTVVEGDADEQGSSSPGSQAHEDGVGRGSTSSDSQARQDAAGTGSDEPSLADAREDADVVRCRECGAENERGYRYCRHCVSELPGATPIQRSGSTPIGGLG